MGGPSECELEVLHCSGTRTQNTGTPRTFEHRQLKSHGNSLNCHGIVLSDLCGNPVIYGTNKNDISHSHFENI